MGRPSSAERPQESRGQVLPAQDISGHESAAHNGPGRESTGRDGSGRECGARDDAGSGQECRTGRGGAGWARAGVAAGLLGGPVGAGHLDRVLGHVLAVSEVGVLLLIVLAALVGSRTVSERAFRLLRWAADRPEPPAPEPATPEPATPDPPPASPAATLSANWRPSRSLRGGSESCEAGNPGCCPGVCRSAMHQAAPG